MDTIDIRYGPLDIIEALPGMGEVGMAVVELYRSEEFSILGAEVWESMVKSSVFFESLSQVDKDRMIFRGPDDTKKIPVVPVSYYFKNQSYQFETFKKRLSSFFEGYPHLGDSEKVVCLRQCLEGRVAEYFESRPDDETQSYSKAVLMLENRYKAPVNETLAVAELSAMTQKPDESELDFRDRIGEKLADAYPEISLCEREKMLLSHFCKGISHGPRREYIITIYRPETMDAALRAYRRHAAKSAILNSDPEGYVARSNDEVVEREAELVSVPCGECALIQKECEREVGLDVMTHGERLGFQKECEREMVVVMNRAETWQGEWSHGERSRFQEECEREMGVDVTDGTETGQGEWDQDIDLQLATEVPWECWEIRRLCEYGAFRPILPDIAGVGFAGWLQSSEMDLPPKLPLPACRGRPPDVLFTTVSDMLHSAAVNDHRSVLSDMWNEIGLAHEGVGCDMSMLYDVMGEQPVWNSEDSRFPNGHSGVLGDSDVRTGIFWPSSSVSAMDVWWIVDLGKPPDFLHSGTVQSALHKMWMFGSGRPPDNSGTSFIGIFTDRFRFATCGMHELFFHRFLGAEPGKPPNIQSDASWCLVSELLFHRYSCTGPCVPLCVPLEVVHSMQIKSSIEVCSHICDNAFLECVGLLRLPSYTALWVVMIYAGFMVFLSCTLMPEGTSGPLDEQHGRGDGEDEAVLVGNSHILWCCT